MDVHHRLPVRSHLFSCWYAAPQAEDDARRLFDAACTSAGLDADPPVSPMQPRAAAIALALGREWGIGDLEARIATAIEAEFEPTWDRRRGEFTWGLGLGEEHPRGQFNAFLAAAEVVSRGAWARLSAAPLANCPQVVGVDFPNVALASAYWERGTLRLALEVLDADPSATTSFEVQPTELDKRWQISGNERARIEPRGNALRVTTPLASGDLEITASS